MSTWAIYWPKNWPFHIIYWIVIIKLISLTYWISKSCEFDSRLWQGVLDTILCYKVCQWLATGRWFSPGTPVSFTNKTDRHDITEILLKVALNTKPVKWLIYDFDITNFNCMLNIAKYILIIFYTLEKYGVVNGCYWITKC